MPELPEVEHAARTLRRWLGRTRILGGEAGPSRIFRGGGRERFLRELRGARLAFLERRGKYVLVGLDNGGGFLSHLGMTGKWVRRKPGEPAPRHSRARLLLPGGVVIHYVDQRLFGRITPAPAEKLRELPEIRALGPDPLLDGIDARVLGAALARTSRPVKVALLDQALLAGIGNIYATEALFRARLHPALPGNRLEPAEVRALVRGLRAALAHGLAADEGEEITYVEEDPRQNPFLIYDRAGTPCPRCGTVLEKLTLGGRTSAFCPSCQPALRRKGRARAKVSRRAVRQARPAGT